MKGTSRLGLSARRLYEAFSEAESVSFSGAGFLSGGVRIGLNFLSNEGLFLKIKRFKILLYQGDQFII